jgi:ATP-binding cassette subfamily A (ABC1) protein 3
MEEAEYLSTRVGIMVNGNFKCLGSPERVKTKYSDGFFLSI